MSVTWLHISDLHVRGGDPYDRDVVLRALVKSVAEYRGRGRAPDVIFATGDIAHAGKPPEYEIAGKFFDDLLAAAKLNKSRLFVIPGNHDVDRDLGVGLARTLDSREQSDTYFRPDLPKPHLTQKLRAFLDWHNKYFNGIRAAPDNSTCGPVELLAINGRRLGILPINDALFCQDDHDHDKLWVGRRCLDASLSDLRKIDSELNIVLVHHPLEWLSAVEGSNIAAELESAVHILLRGHLHETRIESVASAEGQLLRCAAGAAYQSRKWPNRALYGTLQGSVLSVYPIRYEDAPKEVWTTDPSVFPREDKHEKSFQIPGLGLDKAEPQAVPLARSAPPLRFRGNIESRGNLPFVGRDDLPARIANTLSDTARENVMVLHGPPGVGKSELAREFARLHRDRYSGGIFLVDASTDAVAVHLAAIGKNILDLDFRSDLPLNDQGQQTFYALGAAPVLLIYDNVVSFERVLPWLPFAGMPCHVLLTTLLDISSAAWSCIEVLPLSPKQSVELASKLIGGAAEPAYASTIADYAGGLPVQIVPAARTLAHELRRGRLKSGHLALAREATESFRGVYERLDQPARLLLRAAAFLNPQRIPIRELSGHLSAGAGWSDGDFARAFDTCLDLHLLAGTSETSMHQLFASFLRETATQGEEEVLLGQIREVQKLRLLALANSLAENPADTESAAVLISYPVAPEIWIAASKPVAVSEGTIVGRALRGMGRFDEARAWFERAVAEKEKGDVHGRIDHESLGNSLHQVGGCLSSTGRFDEARAWFERAVAEKEKGDVHGRIDHASLGISLNQVGGCLSSTGRFDEARPWFERSVAEKEKGDVHGRIDHESLGNSLHQVGDCLSRMGRFDEARPWFERAVAEKEKGDVHGRVDHESLGNSLHQVGYCYSSTGRFEEARPWFERAVAEKREGRRARARRPREPGKQPASGGRLPVGHGPFRRSPAVVRARRRGGGERGRARAHRPREPGQQPASGGRLPVEHGPVSTKRGRGSSARWRRQRKGTCTGASTTRAWAAACIRWATACRARASMRKRGRGSSARSRKEKRGRARAHRPREPGHQPASGGRLPVEHGPFRRSAAMVRARRRGREKGMCTGASTTRASASACIGWATACRARAVSTKRGHGSSARSRKKKKGTCTGASTTRACLLPYAPEQLVFENSAKPIRRSSGSGKPPT